MSMRRPTWLMGLLAFVLAGSVSAQDLPGDADGNGVLSEADLDALVDDLLGRASAPGTADCEGDGRLSIADATCLVHVLQGLTEVSIEPAVAFVTPTIIQEFEAVGVAPAPPDVTWSADAGTVLGVGARVLYQPPAEPGEYFVTASSLSDPSRSAVARVVVTLDPRLSFVGDRSVALAATGQQRRLEVEVLDGEGLPVDGDAVTWESADPARISVAADGSRAAIVTVVDDGVGTTLVTARWGELEATAPVSVVRTQPGTVLLDSALVLEKAPGELTLARTPETEALPVGAQLLSGDLAGVLDRVLAVEVQADRVVLEVEPIELIEALADVDLDFEGPEVEVQVREVEEAGGEPVRLVRLSSPDGRASLQRVSPGITCTLSGTDDPAAGIDVEGPSFSARFTLRPRIVLKAGLLSGVTEFSMTLNTSLNASAKTGSVVATLVPPQPVTCQKNIGELSLPSVPVYAFTFRPVAAFPVGVTVDLSQLAARAEIAGPEGMAGASGRAGIRYTSGGGWQPVAESSVDGSFVPFTLASDLPEELTVGLEAFGKVDVGIAADLGRGRLAVELVRFNFFEAAAGGAYDLTVRPPVSTLDAAYTGPDWDLDLFFRGKLKAELSTGPLFTLTRRIGINLAVTLDESELFNVTRVLDESPATEVVARTLAEGVDRKILEVDAGARDESARTVRVSVRSSEELDGTADLASSKDGSSPLADFGSAPFAGMAASRDWSPGKAEVGDWLLRGRAKVDLLSGVLPYASSDAVLVQVKEADLAAPDSLALTAEVQDPASEQLVLGNGGTIALSWSAGTAAPFSAAPAAGSIEPGMQGGPVISATCPATAQTIQGSVTLATNDPDAGQRDTSRPVSLTCTANQAPAVAFGVDGPSTTGDRPFSVPFVWTATDPPHAMPVLPCTFDPGDGSGEVEIADCTRTTGRTHVYQDNGTYTATLLVRDSKGLSTMKSLAITVNAPPQVVFLTADPESGPKPLDVTFDWLVTDDDADDALSCTLDFGDGDSTTIPDCTATDTAQHRYDTLGGYTARLTVTDSKSSSAHEEVAISVQTDASVVVLGQDVTDAGDPGPPKFYRVFLADGSTQVLADWPAGELYEAFASLSAVLVDGEPRIAYWKDARFVDDGAGNDLNDFLHRFRLIDVAAGTDEVFVATDMIFNSGQRLSFTPSGEGVLFIESGAQEKVERAEVSGLNLISNVLDLGVVDDEVSPPCGLQPIYVDVSESGGAREWRILAGCVNWSGFPDSVQFSGIVLYDPATQGRLLFPAPVGALDFANPVRTPAGRYLASAAFGNFSFETQLFTTPGADPTTLVPTDLTCTSDLVDGLIACLEGSGGLGTTDLLLLDEDTGQTSVLVTDPPLLMKPSLDVLEPVVVGAP